MLRNKKVVLEKVTSLQPAYHLIKLALCQDLKNSLIYPNPFANTFNIESIESIQNIKVIKLLDLLGKEVHCTIIENNTLFKITPKVRAKSILLIHISYEN